MMRMRNLIAISLAIALVAASPAQADDCLANKSSTLTSEKQVEAFKKLGSATKPTVDRVLGKPYCKLSGYGQGLSGFAYRLQQSQDWFVVVFKSGKVHKSGKVQFGKGLRDG